MPQFIQVPPDSTGKKVLHSAEVRILYRDAVKPFVVGDQVVGASSNMTGSVTFIHEHNSTSGHVDVVLSDTSYGSAPVVGEALRVNGETIAIADDAGSSVYLQRMSIASGDNPHNMAHINRVGALKVAQAGGDAFGRIQMSQSMRLAEYVFTHPHDDKFLKRTANGGGFEHHPEFAGMTLRVTGVNASSSQLTSHLYHKYQAGLSQLVMMTTAMGDSGKEGVVRRWGYYDDNDGMFFEQDGTDLYAVIRSSVTGVVVDTRIHQNDWSTNRINGEKGLFNITEYDVDVTKDNIWWFDMQWLGAGTVRFGTFHDGERLECHEQHHDGRKPVSYMRTGSLPVRFEVFNKQATGSTSEMRVFCCSVQCEGQFSPEVVPHGRCHADVDTITSHTDYHIVSSMRMKQLYRGRDNRGVAIPQNFSVYASGAPVLFEVVKNAVIGAPDDINFEPWDRDPGPHSGVEFDYASHTCTGGEIIIARIIGVDQPKEINLTQQFGLNGESVKRHADINEFDTYSFRCRLLKPGTPAEVTIALEWCEIR